jgi:tRNA A37 methylthiotransferase MiaB
MERPDEDPALMRAQRIMEIQQEVMERFCEKRLGKTEKVCVRDMTRMRACFSAQLRRIAGRLTGDIL